MYLRPASSAQHTASASGWLERTLASFTSIGRLTPAITSTPWRCIIEMARLDGVPPNMSVSRTTPSPVSHRVIQRLDLGAAVFDIVVRSDADRIDVALRCRPHAPWRGAAPRPGGRGSPGSCRSFSVKASLSYKVWSRIMICLRPPAPEPASPAERTEIFLDLTSFGASRSVK